MCVWVESVCEDWSESCLDWRAVKYAGSEFGSLIKSEGGEI